VPVPSERSFPGDAADAVPTRATVRAMVDRKARDSFFMEISRMVRTRGRAPWTTTGGH
jgi:hypothetical protein